MSVDIVIVNHNRTFGEIHGRQFTKNIITLFTIQYSTAYNLLRSLLYSTLRNNTNLTFRTVLILTCTQDTNNTTQYLLCLQSDTVVFSTVHGTVQYLQYLTYNRIQYSLLTVRCNSSSIFNSARFLFYLYYRLRNF